MEMTQASTPIPHYQPSPDSEHIYSVPVGTCSTALSYYEFSCCVDFIDHFSGPGRAIGLVCASACPNNKF